MGCRFKASYPYLLVATSGEGEASVTAKLHNHASRVLVW